MLRLGSEPHGSTVAATSAGLLVIGTAGVPGKTEEDGTVASVIVLVVLLKAAGNDIVDLLVVLLGRLELLDRGARATLSEEVVTSATGRRSTSDPDQGRGATGLASLGRVIAATTLAEDLPGSSDESGATGGGSERHTGELAGSRSHRVICVGGEEEILKILFSAGSDTGSGSVCVRGRGNRWANWENSESDGWGDW